MLRIINSLKGARTPLITHKFWILKPEVFQAMEISFSKINRFESQQHFELTKKNKKLADSIYSHGTWKLYISCGRILRNIIESGQDKGNFPVREVCSSKKLWNPVSERKICNFRKNSYIEVISGFNGRGKAETSHFQRVLVRFCSLVLSSDKKHAVSNSRKFLCMWRKGSGRHCSAEPKADGLFKQKCLDPLF